MTTRAEIRLAFCVVLAILVTASGQAVTGIATTPSATTTATPTATTIAATTATTPSANSTTLSPSDPRAQTGIGACTPSQDAYFTDENGRYRQDGFRPGGCWQLPLSENISRLREVEYEGYDGWYNNVAHPELGGADSALIRILPPAYSDGSYHPSGQDRPNPFKISEAVFRGETGFQSSNSKTALLVFFGQQVVEEILDAQAPGCPPEYFNIPVPVDHPHLNPNNFSSFEMPLLRSRYDMRTGFSPNNPRQQLNEITPYMDGGLTYGVTKAWADSLREFEGGRLARDTSESINVPVRNTIRLPMANPPPPRDHPQLKNVNRFWRLGNPRGDENPFLLTFGVLWFRWHNYLAHQFQARHVDEPEWTDERIFNEARKWVIATHQHVVMYEWLPSWLGPENSLDPYTGYHAELDPGISAVFQSAAMRFGHTLVPPGVYRRNSNCEFRVTTMKTGTQDASGHKGLRTCNTFWNPQESIRENDIDELLLGMASQVTEREDNIITPDLRGFVFGGLEFNRRDLMAVNIQRGRDHGLTDYMSARRHFNLPAWDNFEDYFNATYLDDNGVEVPRFPLFHAGPQRNLSEALELRQRVEDVFDGRTDQMDIWPGGMLETRETGPGELFTYIIRDQFKRIRDGDRFWYENYRLNGQFTEEEVDVIRNITLRDIIMSVTQIPDELIGGLQADPFRYNTASDPCAASYPGQMQESGLAACTSLQQFDFFSGSEISYALTFLAVGLFGVGCVMMLVFLAKRKERRVAEQRKMVQASLRKKKSDDSLIPCTEWQGHREGERTVQVRLGPGKVITILNERGKTQRTIDMSRVQSVMLLVAADQHQKMVAIKIAREYDQILKLPNVAMRTDFIGRLESFLGETGIGRERREMKQEQIFKMAFTKLDRQLQLEKFFRVAFAQVKTTRSPEAKAKLLFDMYDISQDGHMSREEFRNMLRSFMELANEKLANAEIDQVIDSMFKSSGLTEKQAITFDDFQKLLSGHQDVLNYATLNFEGAGVDMPKAAGREGARDNATTRARKTIIRAYSKEGRSKSTAAPSASSQLKVETQKQKFEKNRVQNRINAFVRFVENHRMHIFWFSLYTLVTIGVFAERAYYYSVEREHAGLRRIAGYGVTITRGAASGMMFTYSCLLVTMSRNTITFFRETFLHRFIPFDSAIAMHKYIAFWALLFTVFHVIGHAINFYHISTQTANDLTCLFRNFFHATHELPKFHYWCWGTITGFSGVLVTLVVILIYTFAIQYSRRHVFKWFWATHNLYVVMYILMFIHGAGRLVQNGFFFYFFLGPGILFTLDRLVSISRKKIEIAVIKAEILPSDVTALTFKRPQNFEYRSGQWVRIACVTQGRNEYHPFTLTSSPHEEHLTLHIRAVGPWTINLRSTYDPNVIREHSYPKLYLDGPYGEGHQDWYKFEVAVLVGGGIGVTPFASILKDLVSRSSVSTNFACKKVYFLWVTRTQKQFEWMTDIIQDVENNDTRGLVSTHIFITQFYQKFDLRTTMLYVCESHFQKISGRSLFTGLKSITHFGRPQFASFLNSLQDEHPEVAKIGVFSCGPPLMTSSVDNACAELNTQDGAAFLHHFENF
ncbi:PREDICTED: dual oxidase 2-like [Priapulus caudatus]|uniref:NAD(P)H oxidase (H2O2-forming) n=1 Tax=Priapulus caudatus TaxID=37621 RepID=A0ABM1DU40_PRICU|nr:PREDICTED: dual oxidase 2-like [Priapulus caudatus]